MNNSRYDEATDVELEKKHEELATKYNKLET